MISPKNVPVLPAVPVLAANFSWRNGKKRDKLFSERRKREFANKGLPQLAHPLFANLPSGK